MKILIECTEDQQREIEEICLNRGISFSEYLLQLHDINAHHVPAMKEEEEVAEPSFEKVEEEAPRKKNTYGKKR